MKRYICQHCRRDLGVLVDGEDAPRCPDHECGVVEIIEESEDAEVDS